MYNFLYSYEDFKGWDDQAEGMQIIHPPVDYLRVQAYDDVVYATKDGVDLVIRFIFPEDLNTDKKYPLLIHVQGSGWAKQNLNSRYGDYYELVKSGIGIAVVQYRWADIAKFPAQIIDTKTAARFIMEHCDEYPIDIDKIFLSGDSSGGHTAVLAFLTWDEGFLDDDDERPLPELNGLIDIYGVTDIGALCNQESGLAKEDNALLADYVFDDIRNHPDLFAQANAMCYVELIENLPKVLILHGNKDRLVPLSHSVEFYKALKARNADVRFYMIDKADHGHSVFWVDEVKQLIIDFIKE